MTELTDRLVGDSRESINEIRSCYLERIEELQKALEVSDWLGRFGNSHIDE